MKYLLTKTVFIIAFLITLGSTYAFGQTTLALGDLAFTSYSADATQANKGYSFVLLLNISAGTEIRFTDRAYTGASFAAATSTEGTVKWVSGTALPIGTEVFISNQTNAPGATVNGIANGTVTRLEGQNTYGTSISAGGDQIFAFQGDINTATYTLISGIHFNYCTTGATTQADWDNIACYNATTPNQNASLKPSVLVAGSSAFWVGTAIAVGGGPTPAAYGKFNCTGVPSTNVTTIRSAIYNQANWTLQNTAFSTPPTPAGCTYYGSSAPVVTANPVNQSICAAGTTSFSVTATGATSYQWQVSTTGTGGTYTNVANGTNYSGATTTTLNILNAPPAFNGYAYRANTINTGGTTPSTGAVLTVTSGSPVVNAQPSDATVCPTGTAIISGAATGGTIAYKWQVDNGTGFVDITDGGIYSNSTTGSLTITGPTSALYGYKYRFGATNACGTTYSNAATLTIRNNWTGSTNSNWNNAANWACNTIPDALTDVVINPTLNMPLVNVNSTAHNITISAGAILTMGTSVTLAVTGDITNLGTFTANTTGANVSFNGAASQIIPANIYTNLSISGGVNKTLAGNATVNGIVTFSATTKLLLGNNTLTLGTSASFSGANSSNYFVTNGTGGLKKNNLGASTFVFAVGTLTSYTPLAITNTGTADNITARIADGVYANYIGDVPQGAPITSKAVNKTWFLSEDVPGGTNATLILQWNSGDELASFNRNLCFVSHYEVIGWNPAPAGAATGAAGPGPYTISRSGITSFSPFGVGNIGSPLPLKLIRFAGSKTAQGNLISWQTSDEKNVAGFGLERSYDGISFEPVYTAAARNASGNSNYDYTDMTAGATIPVAYYRLKMNELDGTYNYSSVISIDQRTGTPLSVSLQVSPNPVTGSEINVKLLNNPQAGELDLTLADMTGKIWYQQHSLLSQQGPDLKISVKSVPAGIYMLKMQAGNTIQHLKLVRQ